LLPPKADVRLVSVFLAAKTLADGGGCPILKKNQD
jgi:hypothetical protein